MPAELSPLYRHLAFNTPLSEGKAAELVSFLSQHSLGTVVDVGCGWAALLIRFLNSRQDACGIGIDLSPDSIAYAEQLAAKSEIDQRLELICGDVKEKLPAAMQGAICIGASQIWGPPVDAALPLDYSAALTALRQMVRVGAPVVYGEGIWSVPPTEAAVTPLGGRRDEFVSFAELIDMAWDHGFAVVHAREATLDEWDEFESGHGARYSCWLADHTRDHPDAADVQTMARRHRDAYFRGYRGILGMAYLSLLAV